MTLRPGFQTRKNPSTKSALPKLEPGIAGSGQIVCKNSDPIQKLTSSEWSNPLGRLSCLLPRSLRLLAEMMGISCFWPL